MIFVCYYCGERVKPAKYEEKSSQWHPGCLDVKAVFKCCGKEEVIQEHIHRWSSKEQFYGTRTLFRPPLEEYIAMLDWV